MSSIKEYLEDENLTYLATSIFKVIDKDNSGQITSEELRMAMKKYPIGNTELLLDDSEIEKTIQMLDQDCSGYIDFDEFKDFIRVLLTSYS